MERPGEALGAAVPTEGTGAEPVLAERWQATRQASEALCHTLAAEDYVVQSMPDVSPSKWHLAHTSWFFETFLLQDAARDYTVFHPSYASLFNSYYNMVGPQFPRPQRGLLSRPTVNEVYAYRQYVDRHMHQLFDQPTTDVQAALIELGIQHEQQHQELLLTDIKHVFWTNPLRPALREDAAQASESEAPPLEWRTYPEGLVEIGHADDGFAFDNESPRHPVYVQPFALASRLVTNAEYAAFIADGGYTRPDVWLSDGWARVRQAGWQAPIYWEQRNGGWEEMTLGGMRPLDPHAPVCHVSHYEADAYARWAGARWAGARLPTEAEWEVAAAGVTCRGNFVESGRLHPTATVTADDGLPQQLFGDVWEWTSSAYLPYPGYTPPAGAVGEYNGKFMSGQMVLRGGSCATPVSHIRPTYRNFFPPDVRWQFSGLRLARPV